jgi:hypothetical protein
MFALIDFGLDIQGALEMRRFLSGHAHGIVEDPETGTYSGGADPRSDGAAIGYRSRRTRRGRCG